MNVAHIRIMFQTLDSGKKVQYLYTGKYNDTYSVTFRALDTC